MVTIAPSRTWLAAALVGTLSAVALVLSPAPAQANGCISPAAGTPQSPYLIATEANLDCLMSNANDYWAGGFHFRQTADLDMSNYAAWTHGIGSDDTAFNGTYDGNGFSIDNLTITSSGSGVGLFGVTSGATLKDISVTNLHVSGDRSVGGLVGVLDGGAIQGAYVSADVTAACTTFIPYCATGGLVGLIDDSAATTISGSSTNGTVTSASFARGTGGLVGVATPTSVSIINSFSRAQVSGYNYVGGLLGVYVETTFNESLAMTNSYAAGAVTGSADLGGLIGCLYDNQISNQCDSGNTSISVADSYWDTQATGRSSSAGNRGQGRTTAQMTSLGNFGNWSIDDTTPNLSTIWGICAALNSGYPFLQWISAQEGWTCAAPPPPPDPTPAPAPIPATPPKDVLAEPGDASANVSWSAPTSSGSYAVSTYLVRSSPEGRTCLTAALKCTVTGLRNGTAYTFTVEALTGAGWSSPSAPSASVTPTKARSIVITGTRQGSVVVISGVTTGMPGQELTVMVRFRGERKFSERGRVMTSARGDFVWRTRVGKTVHIYVAGDGVTSNRVAIPR